MTRRRRAIEQRAGGRQTVQQPAGRKVAQHRAHAAAVVVVVMRDDQAGQFPDPRCAQERDDDALARIAVGECRTGVVQQGMIRGTDQHGGALPDVDRLGAEMPGGNRIPQRKQQRKP
jgi:hypothetical protein